MILAIIQNSYIMPNKHTQNVYNTQCNNSMTLKYQQKKARVNNGQFSRWGYQQHLDSSDILTAGIFWANFSKGWGIGLMGFRWGSCWRNGHGYTPSSFWRTLSRTMQWIELQTTFQGSSTSHGDFSLSKRSYGWNTYDRGRRIYFQTKINVNQGPMMWKSDEQNGLHHQPPPTIPLMAVLRTFLGWSYWHLKGQQKQIYRQK